MKMIKKVATLLLAICLVVPCFFTVSHAANQIQFEDPSTSVGQVLQLKGVIKSDSAIEDRTVVISYDTSMLKFKTGENITETEAGKLTYSLKGQRGNNRVEFLMDFDVLQEGTTKVQVDSYEIFSATGSKLNYTAGFATVTIAAGTAPIEQTEKTSDEKTDVTVEIDGKSYVISEEFEESDIPEGFEEGVLEYSGKEYKVVVQEATGLSLVYLLNEKSEGEFFLYVQENATFAPFKEISISESTKIVLLTYVEDLELPETYTETTVEVNGHSFPAWQSADSTDLCIIYAMNNRGEKSLYQFDTVENTYQRFELPEVEEEKVDNSLIGKISAVLEEHMDWVVLGVGLGFVIFLIIVIVLGVKLRNRNLELDELYDEYGIDLGDDQEEQEDKGVIRIDEDSDFEEIDYGTEDEYETEDDIVIAGLDEVEETSEESALETEEDASETEELVPEVLIEETLESQDIMEEDDAIEESIRNVSEALKTGDDYWDDDFEMSFIDLDD